MAEHLFLRTTVAIIWDFDATLIPGYMQVPLFRRQCEPVLERSKRFAPVLPSTRCYSGIKRYAIPEPYLRQGRTVCWIEQPHVAGTRQGN